MPDLQGRDKYEDELAAVLLLSWQVPRFEALAGREPDWKSMERQIATEAEPVLRKAQRKAALGMFDEVLGTRRSPPGFDPYKAHAAELAAVLAQSRQASWDQMKKRVDAGEGSFTDWVKQNLTRQRAKDIGVTEVTDAISTGEEAARVVMRDALGMELVPIWNIDPRSNVCQICRPLNGKPESFWVRDFPTGPPAHPRCACFKTYRNRREFESIEARIDFLEQLFEERWITINAGVSLMKLNHSTLPR